MTNFEVKNFLRPVRRRCERTAPSLNAMLTRRLATDPHFIVGCGRSGTTLLGRILSSEPRFRYREEPRAYWHFIDERTDEIGLFTATCQLRLTNADVTNRNLQRRHVCRPLMWSRVDTCILDKTPAHVFRLHWLAALFPTAKFIHLVRNPGDVVESIKRRSAAPLYNVTPAKSANQWWGRNEQKKQLLGDLLVERYGVAGMCAIDDDRIAAIVEWFLSAESALTFGKHYPCRILHVRYEDLCSGQIETLSHVLDFLHISESRQVEYAFRRFARIAANTHLLSLQEGDIAIELIAEIERISCMFGYEISAKYRGG